MKLFGPKYPEEVAKRVPPGNRLVKGWPVLHYGPVPKFDESTWDFKVYGLVENPLKLSYAELKALGPVKVQADMHCVTGWTTLDNEWEGVPFRVLKDRVRPLPNASLHLRVTGRNVSGEQTVPASRETVRVQVWLHAP